MLPGIAALMAMPFDELQMEPYCASADFVQRDVGNAGNLSAQPGGAHRQIFEK
jgi:hypothetical protein